MSSLATSTSVNKCYLLEQKKVFTEEKKSISHRIGSAVGLGHQHGQHFIVFWHKNSRRKVMQVKTIYPRNIRELWYLIHPTKQL